MPFKHILGLGYQHPTCYLQVRLVLLHHSQRIFHTARFLSTITIWQRFLNTRVKAGAVSISSARSKGEFYLSLVPPPLLPFLLIKSYSVLVRDGDIFTVDSPKAYAPLGYGAPVDPSIVKAADFKNDIPLPTYGE